MTMDNQLSTVVPGWDRLGLQARSLVPALLVEFGARTWRVEPETGRLRPSGGPELPGMGTGGALAARLGRRLAEDQGFMDEAGIRVMVPGDPEWPSGLSAARPRPRLITLAGSLPAGRALAIVGARRCSPERAELARSLAERWVRLGGWVVSGGAAGIDRAAHQGALDGGGRTVVVQAGGLRHPYPKANIELFRRILERGGLLSEWSPSFSGRNWTFVSRNRLISALAEVLIVAQAGPRSGALKTAIFGLQYGRKVLTVPNSMAGGANEGAASLLQSGAGRLEAPGLLEILWEDGPEAALPGRRAPLLPRPAAPPPETLDPVRRAVLEALAPGARHIEDIRRAAGIEMGRLCTILLKMELDGWVEEAESNLYRRIGT